MERTTRRGKEWNLKRWEKEKAGNAETIKGAIGNKKIRKQDVSTLVMRVLTLVMCCESQVVLYCSNLKLTTPERALPPACLIRLCSPSE